MIVPYSEYIVQNTANRKNKAVLIFVAQTYVVTVIANHIIVIVKFWFNFRCQKNRDKLETKKWQ